MFICSCCDLKFFVLQIIDPLRLAALLREKGSRCDRRVKKLCGPLQVIFAELQCVKYISLIRIYVMLCGANRTNFVA
jgi:hypothetical protein